MKILALDTTTELGSIALTDDGCIVEEVILPSGDGFAHILFTEIETLLARHQLTLADIEGFAAASGPGTFTGVRVGLAAVKGLAESMGRQIVTVSNLQALASFGTAALRAPTMDARRGDVYGAVYNAALELVREETVMKLEQWRASLAEDIEILETPRPLAAAIGKIAAREFASGHALDPAAVDANYVRRSDAEMMWQDVR